LTGCFPELAANTKRGRKVDGIRPGYLVLALQSHFIVYRETDRLITTIGVLHRRMNIANHV
jgi:toxin ParE1/3/4